MAGAPTAGACQADFGGERLRFARCGALHENLTVHWTVADGAVDTLLEGRVGAGWWVALGWGFGQMDGSSAAVGVKLASGRIVAHDFFAGYKAPSAVRPAGRQKLLKLSARGGPGTLAVRFARTLDSPGAGVPALNATGENPFIWALGRVGAAAPALQHHVARGRSVVDFGAGGGAFGARAPHSVPGHSHDGVFAAHGLLMGGAWLVLAPVAVLVVRFGKRLGGGALRLHRALNSLAAVLTAVGYGLAVARGSHAHRVHLALGTAIPALAAAQLASGLCRPARTAPTRWRWWVLHASLGRALLALAVANAFLGLAILPAPRAWFVVAAAVALAFVAAAAALSLAPAKFPVADEERFDLSAAAEPTTFPGEGGAEQSGVLY